MSILIKDVELDGKSRDIYIEGNRIAEINDRIRTEAEHIIDGKNKAAIPSFVNGHTHAAMTLLRGYADDMELMPWLQDKIWPAEAKMSKEDIYHGCRLACLEMIKTGTTFFNDMYWEPEQAIKAAESFGMRSSIGFLLIDFDKRGTPAQMRKVYSRLDHDQDLTRISIDPHAIYTVSEDNLMLAKEFADRNDLQLHIHLSETMHEVDECMKKHNLRPVEYLEKIGFLGPNVVAAHAVQLTDNELDILAKNGVSVVHNPISNMKLSVGRAFRYKEISERKIPVALGTDGCSSNNNLDMFSEMKTAALLQKHHYNDPTLMPAKEAFDIATRQGAGIFGIDSGEIMEGRLADMLLIDLRNHLLVPKHNLISNLAYSADGSCVDTTICNGKVLMQGRKVDGEEEIKESFRLHAEKLVG